MKFVFSLLVFFLCVSSINGMGVLRTADSVRRSLRGSGARKQKSGSAERVVAPQSDRKSCRVITALNLAGFNELKQNVESANKKADQLQEEFKRFIDGYNENAPKVSQDLARMQGQLTAMQQQLINQQYMIPVTTIALLLIYQVLSSLIH